MSVQDAPARDVALVLCAGLLADGTPTPFLAARLDRAVELYTAGKASVVLVSGDNGSPSYDEPTSIQTYLVALG